VNILFIHQNSPGQFLHLVRHCVAQGDAVVAIGQREAVRIRGVRSLTYSPEEVESDPRPGVGDFAAAVANGLYVARCCEGLKSEGFAPDLVVGHSGWGEILYVKDIWPKAPLLGYFEFFYRAEGADVGFDPEFPSAPRAGEGLRTRNACNLLSLDAADFGVTATGWHSPAGSSSCRVRPLQVPGIGTS
jgi:hypothetical protein